MVAPKTKKESSHNVEFAEGGDTPMFGPQKAGPDKPGNTGKDGGGGGGKFAKGGSGKMFELLAGPGSQVRSNRSPMMARTPRVPPLAPAVPKMPDPNKAVTKPPRLKPSSTRVYGKGGTPLSSAPDMGLRGAGIGYGGFKNGV